MVKGRQRTSVSGASNSTPAEEAAAKALFHELLPRAREEAAKEGFTFSETSPIMQRMAPYLHLDNVTGVFVYQSVDGWYCDVHFKNTPPGTPNSLGNPASNPFRTRESAIENAVGLIVLVIQITERRSGIPEAEPDTRSFQLENMYLVVPAASVEQIGRAAREMNLSLDGITERLRYLLDRDFPEGSPTAESWKALPEDRQFAYLGYAAGLLSMKLPRFSREAQPIKFMEDCQAEQLAKRGQS